MNRPYGSRGLLGNTESILRQPDDGQHLGLLGNFNIGSWRCHAGSRCSCGKKGRKCSTTDATAIGRTEWHRHPLSLVSMTQIPATDSAAVHPHHSRLSTARRPVPRHNHAAGKRPGTERHPDAAGCSLADRRHHPRGRNRGAGIYSGRCARLPTGGGLRAAAQKGKLPHATISVEYSLEYGMDQLEMHADGVKPATVYCWLTI